MLLETEDDLAVALQSAGVGTATWGTGSAKAVADLWREVQRGEATFVENPLRRCVSVVELLIRRADTVLVETGQELADGRRRARNRPPAEKVSAAETCVEAAVRCAVEELGVKHEDVKIIGEPEGPVLSVRESSSYPGLLTEYRFFRVAVQIDSLPTHDFSTQEAGDAVSMHWWEWQPIESVADRLRTD